MRKLIKRIVSFFLIPATRWYLRKARKYTYYGATVTVFPGVFHPGLFYSSKFLIDYLGTQSLKDSTFLELGCGSALISVIAAQAGAHVTASDLNQKAIRNAEINATDNNVTIHTVHSDLFQNLGEQKFDWIIINPPYYARNAENDAELAWYCGENFEYFQKLFISLPKHVHRHSQVIMVLTKGSEIESIRKIGKDNHFEFEMIKEKEVFFDEKDFLFRIKLASSPMS